MKSVVNIGSKVPNIIFNKKVLVVNEKTWTEFGSQVSGEKNVMTIFANEDDYWKYMRNPKNKGKKTFKTKNADGSVTFKTIRYMPRYEVVALGSYDENISPRGGHRPGPGQEYRGLPGGKRHPQPRGAEKSAQAGAQGLRAVRRLPAGDGQQKPPGRHRRAPRKLRRRPPGAFHPGL